MLPLVVHPNRSQHMISLYTIKCSVKFRIGNILTKISTFSRFVLDYVTYLIDEHTMLHDQTYQRLIWWKTNRK